MLNGKNYAETLSGFVICRQKNIVLRIGNCNHSALPRKYYTATAKSF